MDRMRGGDQSALAELYDRYADSLLYPVAFRILKEAPESEEALQDAWLQAWRSAGSYDARRGTVFSGVSSNPSRSEYTFHASR